MPNPHFLSVELLNRVLDCLEPMPSKLGPLMFQFGYSNREVETEIPKIDACLSSTTEPTEYASRVIDVVDRLIGYGRDDFLKMAARKATPNQRKR